MKNRFEPQDRPRVSAQTSREVIEMPDTRKSHDFTRLDNPIDDASRPRWWRRQSTGSKVAMGIATAIVLAGTVWLMTVKRDPAATNGTPVAATAVATSTATMVTVFESDLRDPTRLKTTLTNAHIPAKIQLVKVPVIDGVAVTGCAGTEGDGLPQIRDVLGKEPGLQQIGDRKGIRIETAAIPRGAVLSFVYWIQPGSTTPSSMPTAVLFQGTPPTCKPMSVLPAMPSKPGPGVPSLKPVK
jgi:hypothetical protein